MNIDQYITAVNQSYKTGNATEHTYRGYLQQLIETIVPEVRATNEPKRQTCGAPDYILTRRDIPVGFIEAKDVGDKDLEGAKKAGNKEQFDRYKASLGNIIFTDYLDFHLYHDSIFITKVTIAEVKNGAITALPQAFATFTNLLRDFCSHISQTIKSSKRLAELMAGKARLLSDVIEQALTSDEAQHENSTLRDQMNAFKEILIHDITPKGFADVYAQTIAYGMFAARLHDPTLPTFSRQEAAELIPKTNPFLRKLFGYIAGPDIDDRIKWIVDSLVEIFLASNVEELLRNYGKATRMEDPIIHFYETFLTEYDPKLRKARGVWYTPQPVVSFIVRAVDEILKTEFGLKEGLADNSRIKVKREVESKATADMRSKLKKETIEEEVHRVQILDPATGTGTFLAEVVKQIHKKFEGMQGAWSSYVAKDLLPRLNGFELLMASYAMAHLQLDLLLTETGYRAKQDEAQRLRVYLTNSLEESHPDTGTLFANWLSTEANEANRIKRDTPVMCVIGNPPYSGISSNNGEWISKLIEDYKYIDGVHFGERKHWLNDDYVKFIRYAQHFIEKNGSGIVAFINPHGYLDNPTFRGMRWHLLKTFDKIYTIDLHGNSKKKETPPDGSIDQNVFDIQQGVSINILVKTGRKEIDELGKICHYDLYGKRELKYDFLLSNSIKSVNFQLLNPEKPYLFFVPKSAVGRSLYYEGFGIEDLFKINSVGFVTANDLLNISFSYNEHQSKIAELLGMAESSWRIKYKRGKDSRDWTYSTAKADAQRNSSIRKALAISYRPFDERYTLYTGNSRGVYASPQPKVMQLFLERKNVGLALCKQFKTGESYQHVFITNNLIESSYVSNRTSEITSLLPLYLYHNQIQLSTEFDTIRTPNLNPEIITQIEKDLNHVFLPDENIVCDLPAGKDGCFTPLDVLDYIYAVLHSPSYREKYKEFLKIDFPRVPYPKDAATFQELVQLGSQLRTIHLLENPIIEKPITKYPADGSNIVEKPRFELSGDGHTGKVFISDSQYFEGVPEIAWSFYIGGYQPAQKWLKDRKGRELSFDDIRHYQKVIVALIETARLMGEIDEVDVSN